MTSGQTKIEKEEGSAVDAPKPQNEPQNTKPENAKHEDAESQGSRTPAMAGLAIAVVLLVVGLWLARELTAASKMQDCLMSGRTNCNVIQPQ
ncbi:MAG: hypothetical protein ABSG88_22435 [Bradyrhizobium sp.]